MVWRDYDAASLGLIFVLVALGRCVDVAPNDDAEFAHAMVLPSHTEGYLAMTNHLIATSLGETTWRSALDLPLITRAAVAALAQTDVGVTAPLEVLPGAIGSI